MRPSTTSQRQRAASTTSQHAMSLSRLLTFALYGSAAVASPLRRLPQVWSRPGRSQRVLGNAPGEADSDPRRLHGKFLHITGELSPPSPNPDALLAALFPCTICFRMAGHTPHFTLGSALPFLFSVLTSPVMRMRQGNRRVVPCHHTIQTIHAVPIQRYTIS